ncbi:MAG TPA: hypothetical protein VMR17_08275 [Xanthobacteraceae bacterium]|nr:hypothetical protein [Xanthobacteraceae bacterium]
MLPARYFGSGRSGRHPAIRNILTATVAALVGTIIGGLSVLGVVLAVVEPPNHDIRADARDASTTTGSSQPMVAAAPRPAPAAASSPPPAATTPPAIQVQADSPAPPPQPQTAPPQEQAAAPGPAPTPQTAWPDALTRRTLQDHAQDHANGSDTPQQSSTAQNSSPAATGNDQESFDKKDIRDDAQKPPAPANRSVASRDGITTRLSNTDQAGQRSVSTPPPAAPPVPAARPAIAAQPATPAPPAVSDTADGASPDTARPLFDFFGLFGNDHFRDQRDDDRYRDQRDGDSAPQGDAPPQRPASQTQHGAKARAVRQQRPNGTDQSGEATSANQQQRVIILQDRDNDDAPRTNDSWSGFFGRNDWNDNSHRW